MLAMMFGSHLSIAGGMVNALIAARDLGLDCVQVFTKNQQQWAAPDLKDEEIAAWCRALVEMGWAMDQPTPSGAARRDEAPARVVSHASYLANLASPDDTLRDRSIAMMVSELNRCHTLGIPLLVFHPGSATDGEPIAGERRIVYACAELLAQTACHRTVLCLENVVGAGSTIGREFEQLARLREQIIALARGGNERVGFCLDTCHMHAGGYDLSTIESATRTLDHAENTLGLVNVRCLHVNDSKGPVGSRLDRHAHIGEGTIGMQGFGPWVSSPQLRNVPKIMETPKGEGPGGVDCDTVNVARLRASSRGEPVTITPLATPQTAKSQSRIPKKVPVS
jgi:deoxyribonuclease-4